MKLVPYHHLKTPSHPGYRIFSLNNPHIAEVTKLQNADYVWYCAWGDGPTLEQDITEVCSLGLPVIFVITGDNCYVPEKFPVDSAFFVTKLKPGTSRQWQVPYSYTYDLCFNKRCPNPIMEPREYLACFQGSFSTNPNRYTLRALHKIPNIFIKEGDCWPQYEKNAATRKKNQDDHSSLLQNSYFSLCPAGKGGSSQRVTESIVRGAIPVLLDDDSRFFGDDMNFCLRGKLNQIDGLADVLKWTLESDMQWRRNAMELFKQNFLLIDRNKSIENELGYSEFIRAKCE